ncbi:MAG: hypothetical protein ACP5J5_00595 [Dissulfurimicrobium sp.]
MGNVLGFYLFLFGLFSIIGMGTAIAKPSPCEDCHVKITPMMVKDFNRGKMAKVLTWLTAMEATT